MLLYIDQSSLIHSKACSKHVPMVTFSSPISHFHRQQEWKWIYFDASVLDYSLAVHELTSLQQLCMASMWITTSNKLSLPPCINKILYKYAISRLIQYHRQKGYVFFLFTMFILTTRRIWKCCNWKASQDSFACNYLLLSPRMKLLVVIKLNIAVSSCMHIACLYAPKKILKLCIKGASFMYECFHTLSILLPKTVSPPVSVLIVILLCRGIREKEEPSCATARSSGITTDKHTAACQWLIVLFFCFCYLYAIYTNKTASEKHTSCRRGDRKTSIVADIIIITYLFKYAENTARLHIRNTAWVSVQLKGKLYFRFCTFVVSSDMKSQCFGLLFKMVWMWMIFLYSFGDWLN